MMLGEPALGKQSTAKCQQHIPLSVPDVALDTEKIYRTITSPDRRLPFDDFVQRTEREAEAADQKK